VIQHDFISFSHIPKSLKKKKKNTATPDAQTQRTTYRDGEKRKRGYQKGVQWIGGNGFLLGSLAMANENEKLD
jgi:hypothetical protein